MRTDDAGADLVAEVLDVSVLEALQAIHDQDPAALAELLRQMSAVQRRLSMHAPSRRKSA